VADWILLACVQPFVFAVQKRASRLQSRLIVTNAANFVFQSAVTEVIG